jgi:hypothetical protein
MKKAPISVLSSAFSALLNAEARVPTAPVVRHGEFAQLAAACWRNGGKRRTQMLPELWKSNIQEVS